MVGVKSNHQQLILLMASSNGPLNRRQEVRGFYEEKGKRRTIQTKVAEGAGNEEVLNFTYFRSSCVDLKELVLMNLR